MTSQTLVPQSSNPQTGLQTSVSPAVTIQNDRTVQSIQTHYRSSHQAEFLDITAQIESLLAELQAVSQG